MSITKSYRRQHEELLSAAGEIASSLQVDTLSKDASGVSAQLSKMMGLLRIHLSMEDKSLYPLLLASEDEKVRKTATRFMDEMGGIADVVTAYSQKWSDSKAIENAPAAFIGETKGLITALGKRIEKENNELYPLADQL